LLKKIKYLNFIILKIQKKDKYMLKELLKPEIEELIEQRRWVELRDGVTSWHPSEVAELLLSIDKKDRVLLFRALPRDFATDVFTEYEYEEREALLSNLTDNETKFLLADLSPDDRTDLLSELPAKVTLDLMNMLSPQDLKEARTLLGYPEESVGRLMTPDFIRIKENWTVKDAFNQIRKYGKHSETINRVYVLDGKGRLLDDILLKELILSEEDTKISDLMDYNVVSISAFADQEEAVRYMEKYDLYILPVVDSDGNLVGIVTFDDVFDVSEEEATEDFQKIGGMNPVDQSYLSASIGKLFIKRFPWLFALLLANFITAAVISYYEPVIASVMALVSFIPLLNGAAGNSGTQSATLIIRSLALGEINVKMWRKVFMKELILGILMGSVLGAFTYLRGIMEGVENHEVALVVSLSVVILLIWANLIGGLLPIIITKFNLDPAVVSSPLITTLIDITGISIYFNIAIIIMNLPF
jgi:magnesium transporter